MPPSQSGSRFEYMLLLWSFIEDEIEHNLNRRAAEGWRYRDQLPTGILLEREVEEGS